MSQNKKIGNFDKESGEILDDGVLVYFPKKVKIKERWFMGMQEGFEYLASAPITGAEKSILFLLFSKMDFENFIRISQKEICEFLKMTGPSVSRAMRHLREQGIIIPGPQKTFKLSRELGWKGSVTNMRKAEASDFKESRQSNSNATLLDEKVDAIIANDRNKMTSTKA